MKIQVTVMRTFEDELPIREQGLQTVGEYVDETIRLRTEAEEKVYEVSLTFTDEDREFMGMKPVPATKTKRKLGTARRDLR